MVGCALSGVVLAGTYTLLDHGLRAYEVGAARVESQQTARAALERLAREIRNAGRGPDRDLAALAVAELSRLVLVSDLDADRDSDANGEQITWQLVGSVLRRSAGGGAQPVANGVRALTVRYLDRAGQATSDPAAVRMLEVTVLTGPDGAESSLALGVGSRFSTRVRLRNR